MSKTDEALKRLKIGDSAPDLEVVDATANQPSRLSQLWDSRPAILVFLRHFG